MNQTQFLSEEIKVSNFKKFIFHCLLALMLAISLTFSQASFAEPDAEEMELLEVYDKDRTEDAKSRFEYISEHGFYKMLVEHGIDETKLEHIAFGREEKTGNLFVVIKQKGKKESDVFHLEHNAGSTFSNEHYSAPVNTLAQKNKTWKDYDETGQGNLSLQNDFKKAEMIHDKGQAFANKVITKQDQEKQEKQRQEKQRQEKQRQEKQRQEKQRQERPKQERQEQFRQQEQRRANRVDRLGTRQQKTIKPSTIKPKTQQKTKVITKTKPDIVLSKKDAKKDAKKARDKWYS